MSNEYKNSIPRRSNSQVTSLNNSYSYDYIKYRSILRSTSSSTSSPLNLIFDLDNTLIYSSTQPFSLSDFAITLNDTENYEVIYILKRPHLDDFLSYLTRFSTLYLYTTATREYTKQILNNIDPLGTYFKKVFCREDCTNDGNNNYIKDISKCNTDLSRTIIIDNNPAAYGPKETNPNLIPIFPFHGNSNDRELTKMLKLLEKYTFVDDVRKSIIQDVS